MADNEPKKDADVQKNVQWFSPGEMVQELCGQLVPRPPIAPVKPVEASSKTEEK